MKKLSLALTIGALAFASIASANTIPITNNGDGTDDNFNDITGGGNANAIFLEWLKGEILSYNNNVGPLPPPTEDLTIYTDLNGTLPPNVNLTAGDYLVLHYGTGPGGAPGGGLVALFVTADEPLDIPTTGSGPNGFGGLSFVRVYDHGVPDAGSTVSLLGLGFLCLEGLRRKLGSRAQT
jgi:VPDSG-CTERM motif